MAKKSGPPKNFVKTLFFSSDETPENLEKLSKKLEKLILQDWRIKGCYKSLNGSGLIFRLERGHYFGGYYKYVPWKQ